MNGDEYDDDFYEIGRSRAKRTPKSSPGDVLPPPFAGIRVTWVDMTNGHRIATVCRIMASGAIPLFAPGGHNELHLLGATAADVVSAIVNAYSHGNAETRTVIQAWLDRELQSRWEARHIICEHGIRAWLESRGGIIG